MGCGQSAGSPGARAFNGSGPPSQRLSMQSANASDPSPYCYTLPSAAPPKEVTRIVCEGVLNSAQENASDAAFILRDFLSREECANLVQQSEAFGFHDCGYSRRIRITDRVSVMAGPVHDLLFERARPFLEDVVIPPPESSHLLPQGAPEHLDPGRWIPVGLNPCFRACRYETGGFFSPHHDGGFDDPYEGTRSIKTFMMYLNDDFDGGPTTFYKESQEHYCAPDPRKVIYELKPTCGDCLVFNHKICHDGAPVLSGRKYLLRTEVMYKRLEDVH